MGLVGLLLYTFTIHQGVAPIGEAAVGLAVAGMVFAWGRLRFPWELGLLCLYILFGLVGAIGSRYQYLILPAVVEYLKLAVIFLAACNVIRTREQLRGYMWIWLLLFALYPMRGVLLNYAFGYTMNGRVAWNFSFANPNDLAGLCLMPIAMCAGFLVTERRGLLWLAALTQMFVLIAIVFITQSRGAIIAVALLSVLMVASQRPSLRTLVLCAIGVALVGVVTPSKTWDRIAAMTKSVDIADYQGDAGEGSTLQRYAIWKVARTIIADNPIQGVGLGAYRDAHREYARSPDLPMIARGARDTHSTYLNVIAECGVLGLAVMVALWLTTLVRSGLAIRRLRAWSPQVATQLQFLQFGFIAYLVAAVWGTYQRIAFTYLYVSILYLFSEIYLALAAGGAPSGQPRPSRARR